MARMTNKIDQKDNSMVFGGGNKPTTTNNTPTNTPPKNTSIEAYKKAEQVVNSPIQQVDGSTMLNTPTPTASPTNEVMNKYTANAVEDTKSNAYTPTPTPVVPAQVPVEDVVGDETNSGVKRGSRKVRKIVEGEEDADEKAYKAKQDAIWNNYQDQVNKLNDNTLNAKNEAYQAQQMASKYAENELKQMGLNNTGLVESSNQANINNYMNALTGINNTKAETQATLEQEYKDNLAKLEQDRADEIEAEEEKAKLENEKAQEKEIASAEKYFEYYTDEEREAYLEEVRNNPNLSDETKTEIERMAKAVYGAEEDVYGTFDEQINDSLDEVTSLINGGVYNGQELTEPQKEVLKGFKTELAKATTKEEMDAINTKIKNYLSGRNIDGQPAPSTSFEGAVDVNSGKVNNDGDTFENNYGDRKQGNNFSLNIGGKIKRVQTGQAVLYGSELDNKLESYSQKCGALAVVDGVLYARDQSCWYVVEPRNDSHWKDIKEKYGLTDYGKDYDLGKNGFDNSKASGNQNVRVNLEIKSGKGSKESPYYYDVQKSDIQKSIKEGKIKDGTWVSYNIGNMVYTGEVVDGKLKERRKENEFEYMN